MRFLPPSKALTGPALVRARRARADWVRQACKGRNAPAALGRRARPDERTRGQRPALRADEGRRPRNSLPARVKRNFRKILVAFLSDLADPYYGNDQPTRSALIWGIAWNVQL